MTGPKATKFDAAAELLKGAFEQCRELECGAIFTLTQARGIAARTTYHALRALRRPHQLPPKEAPI